MLSPEFLYLLCFVVGGVINEHYYLLQFVTSGMGEYVREMPSEFFITPPVEDVPDYFLGGPEKGNKHIYPLRITKRRDDQLFSSYPPCCLYLWKKLHPFLVLKGYREPFF